MRAEYQRQLKAGVAEAEAQQAAAEKAYTESADAAAAAGEEAPLRVAVKLSGIPRGGKIKRAGAWARSSARWRLSSTSTTASQTRATPRSATCA